MEGGSSDQPATNPQTIALNVLSPSTEEVPNRLTFTDIPITTTIKALKERIQDAVPARPPLPRQRLIYQGKVLALEQATLKDVFGQEAVSPMNCNTLMSSKQATDRQVRTSLIAPRPLTLAECSQSFVVGTSKCELYTTSEHSSTLDSFVGPTNQCLPPWWTITATEPARSYSEPPSRCRSDASWLQSTSTPFRRAATQS